MAPARSRRRSLAIAFAMLVTVLRPASAAAPSTPQLRAVNVIAASGATSMMVRLPVAASLARGDRDSPDISVSGAGRFAGFALAQQGTDAPVTLVAIRHNFCYTAGCTTHERPPEQSTTSTPEPVKGRLTLPAGLYRLTVFADHASVRVTVRLHGAPSGTATFRPREAAEQTIASGSSYNEALSSVHATAIATKKVTGSSAFLADQESLDVTVDASHTNGTCYWFNTPLPAEGPAPLCRDGMGVAINAIQLVVQTRETGYGYALAPQRAAGTWTQGVYQDGPQKVDAIRSAFLFVSL